MGGARVGKARRNVGYLAEGFVDCFEDAPSGFLKASDLIAKHLAKPGFAELVADARKKLNGDGPAKSLGDLRRATGLSQAGLADLVGTKQPAISLYEAGEREPSMDMIIALSKALGVDFNTLIPVLKRG